MTYPHGGAVKIWRDGDAAVHRPQKVEIRDWGVFMQDQLAALDASVVAPARYVRDLLSELQGISGAPVSAVGYVLSDPDNRGTYEFDGALWTRVADLPLSLLAFNVLDDGSGTDLAISGATHPWLHLIGPFVAAVVDNSRNTAVGVDERGAIWAAALKILNTLDMESFSVSRESSEHAFALEDAAGRLGLALKRNGELLIAGGASLGGDETDWDFALVDPDGYVGFGLKGGLVHAPGLFGSVVDVVELNDRNLAYSASLDAGFVHAVQLPTAVYNTIVNYGQSLGEGNETWPSLSKVPVSGAMMLGDNVDNTASSGAYQVIGSLGLNPLVANTHDGTSNLSAAEEAALSPGDQARGEPPVIGLTNGFKLSMNRRALSENDGRNLVAISPAIGGKTIEQLSKINTQDGVDRYGLLTSGVSAVDGLTGADSHVVPIVTWVQGEWNYRDQGGSWDKTTYKTLMHQLFDDIATDVSVITGQALPPLFMSYQTGAAYTRDVDSAGNAGLHVGMAQLEVTQERDDAVMVGPVYPYTDKGGHLDANGSRWYGHQQAKVARHVLLDGKPWEPLRPLEVTALGADVFISFHVPVAPLVFDDPYVVASANDYAHKGFRVTSADASTAYSISSVEIVAPSVVRLRLASVPAPDALVWYADQTVHNGNGNLRDSDLTVAHEPYEYVPERGMYAAANIPALVGKNYPLHNWCVAFCLPLNYTEFD